MKTLNKISFGIKRDYWLQDAKSSKNKICGEGAGFILYDEQKPGTSMIFFKEEEPAPVLMGFIYEIMSRFVESPEVNLYENFENGTEGTMIIETNTEKRSFYRGPKLLIATKGLDREYRSSSQKSKEFHMLYAFDEGSTKKSYSGSEPMFRVESRQQLLNRTKEIFEKEGYEKLKVSLGRIALLQHILKLSDVIDCNPKNFGISMVKKGQKEYITSSVVDFSGFEKMSVENLRKMCCKRLNCISQDENVVMTKEDMKLAFEKVKVPFKRKKTEDGYYIKDKESKTSFKEVVEESWKRIEDRLIEIGLWEDEDVKDEVKVVEKYIKGILKRYEELVVWMDKY